MRRVGQVGDWRACLPAVNAEWTWGWQYKGDGHPHDLLLRHKPTGYDFEGVPVDRAGDIEPFGRFDELCSNGSPFRSDDPQLRAAWSAWVNASSDSAQSDRKQAIPRMIIEWLTGRGADKAEIAAVAKLCNTQRKGDDHKPFTASDDEILQALAAVNRPASLF